MLTDHLEWSLGHGEQSIATMAIILSRKQVSNIVYKFESL